MSKAIKGNGVNQGDIKDLYDNIKSNFNGVLTDLDTDATYSSFNSDWALSAHGITDTGREWDDEYSFLTTFISNFNSTLTKLDNDGSTNDSDYNSSLSLDGLSSRNINTDGVNQSQYVYLLNQIISNINSLNAKIDGDSTLGASGYATAYDLTDVVNETGTSKN